MDASLTAIIHQGVLYISSSWLWENEQLFLIGAKSSIQSDGAIVLIPFADALLAIFHYHFRDSNKDQLEETITELFSTSTSIEAHFTTEDVLSIWGCLSPEVSIVLQELAFFYTNDMSDILICNRPHSGVRVPPTSSGHCSVRKTNR